MKHEHFIICYSFNGARVVFTYPSNIMTEADACYLSLLHSGCNLASGPPCGGTIRSMRNFVSLSGVTDVMWHRSLQASADTEAPENAENQEL